MTKLRNTFLSLGLAIVASLGVIQPANAAPTSSMRESETVQIIVPEIKASSKAKLKFARPAVATTHSNPVSTTDDTVVDVQSSKPEAPTTAAYAAPVAKNESVLPSQARVSSSPEVTIAATPRATIATPAVAPVSGRGAAILASARSQIGIAQDCTAMVERALSSVGIITGDIGPLDFLRYGTVVSNPQPGDLMVNAGHVAVYAGNGMAVSGGFNGGQTVEHPASYLAGSVYVRV